MTNTGCENSQEIKDGSWKLLLSVIPLLIIEAGCLGTDIRIGATMEQLFWPKLGAIVVTLVLFVAYCYISVQGMGEEND